MRRWSGDRKDKIRELEEEMERDMWWGWRVEMWGMIDEIEILELIV